MPTQNCKCQKTQESKIYISYSHTYSCKLKCWIRSSLLLRYRSQMLRSTRNVSYSPAPLSTTTLRIISQGTRCMQESQVLWYSRESGWTWSLTFKALWIIPLRQRVLGQSMRFTSVGQLWSGKYAPARPQYLTHSHLFSRESSVRRQLKAMRTMSRVHQDLARYTLNRWIRS